jgi:predicted component of type VI protein secretion system
MASMATARLNGETLGVTPETLTDIARLCDDCGEALAPLQSSVDCGTCWRLLFDNHDLWLRLMGLI